jgi:hypothetical protein
VGGVAAQALLLLEYLTKNGSEQVVREAKVHLLQIKTLKDFQYIDEDRKDVGLSGNCVIVGCACVLSVSVVYHTHTHTRARTALFVVHNQHHTSRT